MKSFLTLLSVLVLTAFASVAQSFEKKLIFPEFADSATKIEMAGRLVPSAKQLEWQDLEMTAFIHFGINTFTDREWGNGKESPAIFNPEGLDARQWVRILKDAGFKMVILTAKHHDGFCLWPTETTEHSVASSPWREGNGDVVAELADACHEMGMKLGIYLSPWDRNAPSYGDSEKYNDLFVRQLTELLTNYGKIDEVWFDGACGEGLNGKKQEYDWVRFRSVMESLQPGAVLAIMGDDVRWVGNEKGMGRETEWSATPLTPGIYAESSASNAALGIFQKSPDLGSRELVSRADRMYWWPSEVDVSIRPGWFFHDTEQPRSLRELSEIYLNSVGRNSVLLLNVPPDRSGRIAPADSARLAELGQWIRRNFSSPISCGTVNCAVLQEDISKGQRVEEFAVMAWKNGESEEVARGTTIGHKRILTFDPVEADSLSVKVISSRGEPNLLPVKAYFINMPENEDAKEAVRLADDGWTLSDDGLTIELGAQQQFAGFAYLPNPENPITAYKFLISNDGKNWIEVATIGEFSNIVNNPIEQIVRFAEPVSASWARLQPIGIYKPDAPISPLRLSLLAPQ